MSANIGVGALVLSIGSIAMLLRGVDLIAIALVCWGLNIMMRSFFRGATEGSG